MPAKSQAQRALLYAKFGPEWAKRHHYDNKGPLPEHVEQSDSPIPDWAHYRPEAQPGVSCGTCDFFVAGKCEMFDYANVRSDYVCDRWEGTVEKDDPDASLAPMYTGVPPEKSGPQDPVSQSLLDLLGALEPHPNLSGLAKQIAKRGTNPSTLHLRVNGMTRLPSGHLSYRMVSRDGHYVGRTSATHIHARKGDVLKIQANDFLQDEGGDFAWLNANVVSHYTDAPHDLRELEALAGGSLEKEGAPGPAGDIPPANDMGDSSSMPDGPTLAAVHIDTPLPNISLFYGNKKLKYKMQKAYSHKQLIYGVVLEPNTLDSQDDYMLPDQVESAAHNYLTKGLRGKSTISRLGHKGVAFFKNKPSVVPVESYIAPVDFSYDGKEMVKKGTWVMVLHVEDSAVWDDVLKGEYTGLSIGGTGIRQDMPPLEGIVPSYQDPNSWFK